MLQLGVRLGHAGVKVASHTLVIVGDLVEAGEELPLSIRLNVHNEAAVLEISFKVIDTCLKYASPCEVVPQKLLLARIGASIYRQYPLFPVSNQAVLQHAVYLFP